MRSVRGEGGTSKFALGRQCRPGPVGRRVHVASVLDQQCDGTAGAVGARSARKCKPAGLDQQLVSARLVGGEGGKFALGRRSRPGPGWRTHVASAPDPQ